MARMARVVVPNYPHHVTQRGNRRQKTFFHAADYTTYLELLATFSRKAGTEIWAYCLMPNHVHLVMVPGKDDGLRGVLGEAHRRYSRYINSREGWRGHLWQERFHSFVMDEHYLMATVRYVERNPVVAGFCDKAQQWRWSSARAHIDERDDPLVRVKPMLDRVNDWHAYLAGSEAAPAEEKPIQKHTRTGRPLGSRSFVSELERLTDRPLAPRRPGPVAKRRK
jgi:putative transposase